MVVPSALDAYMATTKKPRLGRPSKPESSRKEEFIRIRVTAAQKERLQAAAERAGLDVSGWLRSLGLREAESGGGES